MSQGRRSIRILGLSLMAALGLMAVTAVGAQASGSWTLGSGLFPAGDLPETIGGTGLAGELLVPAIGLQLSCTSADVINASIKASGSALASVLFLGCTVLNSGVCLVYPTEEDMENETNAGDLTASGAGLVILHESGGVKKEYLLISQHEGKSFTDVYFSDPETTGCNLTLENSVTGSTIMELPDALTAGGSVIQRLKPLLDSEIQSLFRNPSPGLNFGSTSHQLKFGNNNAEIHGGVAHVELKGKNAGAKWGAE